MKKWYNRNRSNLGGANYESDFSDRLSARGSLALGTGHFGTKLTEADAFAQLDRYAEFGNFIDTARVYGDDPSGERSKSERIIGKWLRSSGMAGQMILSTKGGHPTPGKNRAFTPRLHRDELYADVEGSLDFLGVDAIDLYFLHRDDTSLPVGEILETLEEMRRKGLIRFYGCSNWTVERITAAAAYAARTRGRFFREPDDVESGRG